MNKVQEYEYGMDGVVWHQHSNRLMLKLLELLPKDEFVSDIGCGLGYYIYCLRYAGYHACGYDSLNILNSPYIEQVDLTKQKPLHIKQNIISFEVGEHIPKEFEENYLDWICSGESLVIMSWAVAGQDGVGHVNCQNNDYVIGKMREQGFAFLPSMTAELRESVHGCHCTWFRNTLMAFKHEGSSILY